MSREVIDRVLESEANAMRAEFSALDPDGSQEGFLAYLMLEVARLRVKVRQLEGER